MRVWTPQTKEGLVLKTSSFACGERCCLLLLSPNLTSVMVFGFFVKVVLNAVQTLLAKQNINSVQTHL